MPKKTTIKCREIRKEISNLPKIFILVQNYFQNSSFSHLMMKMKEPITERARAREIICSLKLDYLTADSFLVNY